MIRILELNTLLYYGITSILSLNYDKLTDAIFTPSISISPSVGSTILNNKFINEDLPDPVLPINPML